MSAATFYRSMRTVSLALALALAAAAGCAQTGKSVIPAGADEVEAGRGELVYEVIRDGRVWVYDVETNKMVYSGPVRDGDRVRVNPQTNQITVGGETVSEQPLIRDHEYRIYFKRR